MFFPLRAVFGQRERTTSSQRSRLPISVKKHRRSVLGRQLRLEPLEDRSLLSIVVNLATDVVNANDGKTSLREAVTWANQHAGDDTITFDASLAGQMVLLTHGSLSLTDTTGKTAIVGLGSDQLAVNGFYTYGVFSIAGGVEATFSHLSIVNGRSTNGGAIISLAGSNVTIRDCVLAGNAATTGGAIYNAGTLAIYDSTLSSNSATDGGAIYNAGQLAIQSGNTLTENSATTGGAIYNASTLTIESSSLTDNSATTGGGIYTASTLTIEDSSLTNNSATYGAGIYDEVGSATTLAGVSISSTHTADYGGGINNCGTLTVTCSTVTDADGNVVSYTRSSISGNSATYNGGGIYCSDRGTVNLVGCSISGNNATGIYGNGGGIYSLGIVNITSVATTSGGVSFRVSNAVSGNKAFLKGGGIYSDRTLTIRGGAVSGNSAKEGGGIYCLGRTTITYDTYTDADGDTYIITGTISANTASYVLNNTTVGGDGGGIYNGSDGDLIVDKCSISGNSAGYVLVIDDIPQGIGTGGGIYSLGAATIANSTISGNAGNAGGGIYSGNGSTVTITVSTITANTSVRYGGGIYNGNGCNITIVDSTISSNSANSGNGGGTSGGGQGGGIYNAAGSTLTLLRTTLSGNRAYYLVNGVGTGSGGALSNWGSATLIDCTLAANSAYEGGAIFQDAAWYVNASSNFVTDSALTVYCTTIATNSAYNSGGGVYVNDTGYTVAFSNTLIASNSVINTDGTSPDVFGTLTADYCLIYDTTGATINTNYSASNVISQAPQLGVFGDHGGATATFGLLAGSPAINNGNKNLLPINPQTGAVVATDQRGFTRVIDGQVDIGAYEMSSPPIVTLTIASWFKQATPNGTVTVTDTQVGVPDGTKAYVDLDVNCDGDFFDADDVIGYAIGTLTSGQWVFTGATLADGSYGLRARGSNADGGEGVSAEKFITIDTTAPTVTISGPSQTATTGRSVSYTITYADAHFNASTLTAANIVLNTTGTAGGTVSVSGSGTSYVVTISDATGNGTLGISVVAGTASDIAGNLAPAAGPSATFTVTSVLVVTATTSDKMVTINWNTTVDSGSIRSTTLTIDGRNQKVTRTSGDKYSANYVSSMRLAAGFHSFVITTVNTNGTTTYRRGTFTVAPSVPAVSKFATKLNTSTNKIMLSWNVFDCDGIGSTTLVVDGQAVTARRVSGNRNSGNYTAAIPLTGGVHTYTITATDAQGASLTYSGTFTVTLAQTRGIRMRAYWLIQQGPATIWSR